MKSLTTWLAVLSVCFYLTGCKNETEAPADDSTDSSAQHEAEPHEHDAMDDQDAEEQPESEPALPDPNEGGLEAEGGSLN